MPAALDPTNGSVRRTIEFPTPIYEKIKESAARRGLRPSQYIRNVMADALLAEISSTPKELQ